MGSTKLKEDLNNCLITFDRKVLMTQLLDDYKLSHNEVNQIVGDFVSDQEKQQKLKYEKYYVIHGEQQKEDKVIKEIFKIVLEAKLSEWLEKLDNAESSLYAVEVSGGAKAPAAIFKPMCVEGGVKLKQRAGAKRTNGASEKPETSKPKVDEKEIKAVVKKTAAAEAQPDKHSKDSVKIEKKTPVKAEISPQDSKKPVQQKAATKKGGIGNFFAPSANKKSEGAKDNKDSTSSGAVKSPTTKKMQDFFKKQAEKPKTTTETLKKPDAANTSVQLFVEEEEEDAAPEEISSDEGENIEALKRDIISSDVDMNDNEDEETTTETKPAASKRRRILDSDDDEEDEKPPVKHEKIDEKTEQQEEEIIEVEPAQKSETYLDEEGFVITKKPKQKSQSTNKKKSPSAATPTKKPPVKKISPSSTKKISPKSANTAAAEANKKKQQNIMNFFTKK